MAKAATKKRTKNTAPQASGANALERLIRQALHGDDSQPNVTASTVRSLPAAWYSINKICGHIGSLPLNLYHRPGDTDAEIAKSHPAYWLIKREPSGLTAPSVFRETMQHHALLHGNGRAFIARNGRGDPAELIIMQPKSWAIVVVQGGEVNGMAIPDRKYHVRVDDPTKRVSDRDVLHIMGLSDDGIGGIGIIEAAKVALGIPVAQQDRAWSSEKKGVRLKLLLKAPPGAFRDEVAAKNFITAFNDYHSDAENTDKAGLLREGITAETISQTNQEAQAIEARKFARQDIGLLFQIEQMLGDDSSVSYNSLEMKNQAYLTNCLMRWLNRWEEECARKLLTTAQYQSEEWYFKFVTAALLKGTTKDRYEVYQIARQIEVLSANDVRELEDMNQRTDGGGDEYNNPAINPKDTATSGDATNQQPPADTTSQQRLRRVVAARVNGLVNVERSRVEQAAMKEANFCAWLDTFYASWTDRVSAAVSECDGPPTIAASWTTESKQRLLDVAGRVTDGLGEAVRAETALWTERANQLATAILSFEASHA